MWGQDAEPWDEAQSSVADPSRGQQRVVGKLKLLYWKTPGRLIKAEQHRRERRLPGLERGTEAPQDWRVGLSDPRTGEGH